MNRGHTMYGMLGVALLVAGFVIPVGEVRAGDPLVYGGDQDYPPYEYLNERGEAAGFNVDLIRVVARELGEPIEIRLGPWPEIVRQFEVEKRVHITDMFYTDERARRVEYTEAFAVMYDELFVRRDTPNACVYENLTGKQVIVQRATTTEEYLRSHARGAQLVSVDSEPAALRLLAAGFHDCAMASRTTGRLAIRKYRLSNLIASGKPVRPRDYAFVVVKGNIEMRDRINTALLAIKASGEYQRIYDRWFGDHEPPSPTEAFLRTWGGWLLGSSLGLALMIVAWNLALSRRVRTRTWELAATGQRLHDLFDNANDAILVIEPGSGQILDANRRTAELFGYSHGELLDMRVYDLGQPGTTAEVDTAMQRLMTEGHALFERTLRHREGHVIHAEVSSRLIDLEGRQVIESFVRDISERKQAETRLRESESRTAMALEAAGMGSWDWDIPSNKVTWSDNVEAIFGLAPGTFRGTYEDFVELVVPESREPVLQAVRDALAQHSDYGFDYQVVTATGERRWMAAYGRGFYDDSGTPVRMAGTVWDVTERKQGELERERLLRDLERRTAEMEGFVYTISHDLKAPLITISGFSRLLERDLARGDAAQVADSLAEILKASDGMQQLIEDLLSLARTGQIVGEPKEVVLTELFADLASRCAHHIEQEQASVQLIGDLPRLWVDPVRFGQVLQNLVENALTYHRPGVPPKVEIGGARIDGEFRLYVRDNGVGIPAAYRERIFGLFERLDSHIGGTGVGLAIVRRIVEMHGGRVWVDSEPGKGSTFWIALPDSAVVQQGTDSL